MYQLIKEEIECQRTPSEFIAWVECTLGKFQTQEDRIFARSKETDELKILFEESYPLSIFLKHCSQEIKVQQIAGSQSHDVKVYGCEEYEYIEITQAINGEIDALRMMRLNQEGHAPASGDVWKSGKKSHGNLALKFEGEEGTIGMNQVEEKPLRELIYKVVEKKIKIDYPKKTALLIGFDDNLDRMIGTDLSYLEEYMQEDISPLVEKKFTKVFLVGLSGKTFFSI